MESFDMPDFKRLYVSTHQLHDKIESLLDDGISDVEKLDLAIQQIDTMISMMPIGFEIPSLEYPGHFVLYVNMDNAEDEPEAAGENIHTLFEDTLYIVLENEKFLLWNLMAARTNDPLVREKYLPLMLAQAHFCMWKFSRKTSWVQWEKDMYVLYANQVGWFTYTDEQEITKLEAALLIVEKGDQLANWNENTFIKDTKVRLLLKLGRITEAYEIVAEAFKKDPDFGDFLDLKTDAGFLAWQQAQTNNI